MTTDTLLRGFYFLTMSGALAWVVFDRNPDDMNLDRQRYRPYISGVLLPLCLLTMVVCDLLFFDAQTAGNTLLGFCFEVFPHICLYYLLLLPILPFLRRHISARACAVLWILPNYLYLTQRISAGHPEPRWVIEASSSLIWGLFTLWLTGFWIVFGWNILSHLRFRRRILACAHPVADPQVLELWRQEVDSARFSRPKFQLVTSPNVQTPLSIGLFNRSIRVVLPQRDYTPQELCLIFRHELVHIGREDTWSKFFLVFCSAMCWFNPLMWIAAMRSAEDLELSCDETVLLDAGEETRRQYASLLLETAGDQRGFTTCLSASADALRYRLKSVVSPRKKLSGALVVGLAFFLLSMTCGYGTLAYGEGTGAELIYQSQPLEQCTLRSIHRGDDPYDALLVCTDEMALHRSLSALPIKQVTGNDAFLREEHFLVLLLDTPQGLQGVALGDRSIRLTPLYETANAKSYYLPEGAHWDRLNACFFECPAMNVRLKGKEGNTELIGASLYQASVSKNGSTKMIYQREENHDRPNGIFGSRLFQEAEFAFNFPPTGAWTAELTLPNGSSRTAILEGQSATLSLPDSPFRCTVRGTFQTRDNTPCQAEFQFEIGTL